LHGCFLQPQARQPLDLLSLELRSYVDRVQQQQQQQQSLVYAWGSVSAEHAAVFFLSFN